MSLRGKTPVVAQMTIEDSNVQGEEVGPNGSTKHDQNDMHRMGRDQQLRRNYRPLSALSFAIVLTAVWEFLIFANTQGLIDGGLAGLFWAYLWTFIGFGFVILSIAEMASMAPISGGQYHWVSEFAPPNIQKPLSYIIGWMSTLSWQAGNASGSFLTGTIIQALIAENNPSYEAQRWQGTLLVFSMTLLLLIVNIWGAEIWPKLQNGLMILHVITFFVVLVVLWAMAPHQPAEVVFTHFSNEGGWSSIGLALMVGQITGIYSLVGSDCSAHMAEEVRNAGRYVPIAIFWSYASNGILAIIMLVTYLFAIPSVDDAINDPSGYPFIYVVRTAAGTPGVNVLTILTLIVIIAANISFNASTARQTFSFARDKGLPFSDWISRVSTQHQVPTNAIILTSVITALLALINIVSDAAFNAIISLQLVALMLTYGVSISCVLYRRVLHPALLPQARWSLGRWGVTVNTIGLLYVSVMFFWCFWPNVANPGIEDFNWSVVLFVGVLVTSILMYLFQGRRIYDGPVTLVRYD